MKVLVTGAGGFIGSHLVEILVQNGYQVSGFFQYSSHGSLGWLEQSPARKRVRAIMGNISDFDSVYAAVKDHDMVFHLAALIGIPYSYVSPKAYIRTNIEGTYNILESVRRTDVKKVLVTSTSEVYGSAQYTPIDEAHPLVGQSPYSATKIAADQLAVSYHRSFGTPVTIVRPFNTYGPRQSLRAIIPTVICQALEDAPVIHLGNLDAIRDFNFVEDTVDGFLQIATCDQDTSGEVINIATQTAVSIRELVAMVAELLGREIHATEDAARIRPAASEVDRLLGSNAKIRRLSAWHPRHELRAGLQKTIAWFRENRDRCQRAQEYHI